jgi:heat shock protein HslJ
MKPKFNLKFIACCVPLAASLVAVIPPAIAQSIVSQPSLPMAQASSLSGSWQLTNLTEDGTPMVPSQDTPLTAEFSDGSIFGSGGCNRFKGGYTTEGETLSIGPLASTMMACEQSMMQQESRYLKAMQGAKRYEVTDQGLSIFYETDQGSGVLRFTAQTVRGLW